MSLYPYRTILFKSQGEKAETVNAVAVNRIPGRSAGDKGGLCEAEFCLTYNGKFSIPYSSDSVLIGLLSK